VETLLTPLGRVGAVIASALATSTCSMEMEMAGRPTPFRPACCGTGTGEGVGGLWLTAVLGDDCWSRWDGDNWCCELETDTVGGCIPTPEDIRI
jgi:hypothetical protein